MILCWLFGVDDARKRRSTIEIHEAMVVESYRSAHDLNGPRDVKERRSSGRPLDGKDAFLPHMSAGFLTALSRVRTGSSQHAYFDWRGYRVGGGEMTDVLSEKRHRNPRMEPAAGDCFRRWEQSVEVTRVTQGMVFTLPSLSAHRDWVGILYFREWADRAELLNQCERAQ